MMNALIFFGFCLIRYYTRVDNGFIITEVGLTKFTYKIFKYVISKSNNHTNRQLSYYSHASVQLSYDGYDVIYHFMSQYNLHVIRIGVYSIFSLFQPNQCHT